jgi:hypothetical protein
LEIETNKEEVEDLLKDLVIGMKMVEEENNFLTEIGMKVEVMEDSTIMVEEEDMVTTEWIMEMTMETLEVAGMMKEAEVTKDLGIEMKMVVEEGVTRDLGIEMKMVVEEAVTRDLGIEMKMVAEEEVTKDLEREMKMVVEEEVAKDLEREMKVIMVEIIKEMMNKVEEVETKDLVKDKKIIMLEVIKDLVIEMMKITIEEIRDSMIEEKQVEEVMKGMVIEQKEENLT